jgi:hypothetical protein
MSEATE